VQSRTEPSKYTPTIQAMYAYATKPRADFSRGVRSRQRDHFYTCDQRVRHNGRVCVVS
jgi:hypothetical protein